MDSWSSAEKREKLREKADADHPHSFFISHANPICPNYHLSNVLSERSKRRLRDEAEKVNISSVNGSVLHK